MKPKIQQLDRFRDYSLLFTRKEALSWIKENYESLHAKLLRHDKAWLRRKDRTYLDYLKYTYSKIRKNYRNEYVVKNEFLNEWLIEQIGETNSTIFNEFRVGNSVADLLMFNGASKAFEIKTEYDTDSRLSLQIESYKKAFNEVYIIIPEHKIGTYETYEESVGIISFNSMDRNQFKTFRKAKKEHSVDPEVIMKILHTQEYKHIVSEYYGELPKLTSFSQYKICFDLIKNIPNSDLNRIFIRTMKKRVSSETLKPKYHNEFNQLRLALKIDQKLEQLIFRNLKRSITI